MTTPGNPANEKPATSNAQSASTWLQCRPTCAQMPGAARPRCGSFARIGWPLAPRREVGGDALRVLQLARVEDRRVDVDRVRREELRDAVRVLQPAVRERPVELLVVVAAQVPRHRLEPRERVD